MNDPDFSFGEMCVECVAYLDKAIPILSGVSSDLRTAPDKEALGKLGNFDEGLKWLTDFAAKSEIFLPDDGLKSSSRRLTAAPPSSLRRSIIKITWTWPMCWSISLCPHWTSLGQT